MSLRRVRRLHVSPPFDAPILPVAAFACRPQVLDVDYLSEVTKVIPADNLPEFLGGRSPCPVTEGCGWPSVGPWSDGAPAATAAQPGDGQGQAGASTGSGQ